MPKAPKELEIDQGLPYPDSSSVVVRVNLDHLLENYKILKKKSRDAICAVAVKADAYGCGLENVVTTLSNEGCNDFFVAELSEALRTKLISPEANVYVLGGITPDSALFMMENDITPVINSIEEFEEWVNLTRSAGFRPPYVLHFDTGMNRLGLRRDDVRQARTIIESYNYEPDIIMSHFVSADKPKNPFNKAQLKAFEHIADSFPNSKKSLANSGGIFLSALSKKILFDMTRAGLALYGAKPDTKTTWPLLPVMSVFAPVRQIRTVSKGETIGYSATYKATQDTTIATIGIGYADGFLRAGSTSNTSPSEQKTALGLRRGNTVYRLPVLGRISMDLVAVDITNLPQTALKRGDMVEVFGETISIEEQAENCGTIAYELLTASSSRADRQIIWPAAMQEKIALAEKEFYS